MKNASFFIDIIVISLISHNMISNVEKYTRKSPKCKRYDYRRYDYK
jgi:hypothetical protein